MEYLRQHSTVPFLIVQPENVRNVRMRLTSDQDNGGRGSPVLATSPPVLATVAEADEERAAKPDSDEELDESLLFAGGDMAPSMPEATTRPRKIAIAYENDATGQMLLAFAARVVLHPHDSVLLVHCTVGKKDAADPTLSSSTKSLASSLEGGSAKGIDSREPGCIPRSSGVAGVCGWAELGLLFPALLLLSAALCLSCFVGFSLLPCLHPAASVNPHR